jgi:hypothetical protein
MGAAVWGSLEGIIKLSVGGLLGDALAALVPVGVGVAVYVVTARLMRIEELEHLLGRFMRRRRSA